MRLCGLGDATKDALDSGEFDSTIDSYAQHPRMNDLLKNPVSNFVITFTGVVAQNHTRNIKAEKKSKEKRDNDKRHQRKERRRKDAPKNNTPSTTNSAPTLPPPQPTTSSIPILPATAPPAILATPTTNDTVTDPMTGEERPTFKALHKHNTNNNMNLSKVAPVIEHVKEYMEQTKQNDQKRQELEELKPISLLT